MNRSVVLAVAALAAAALLWWGVTMRARSALADQLQTTLPKRLAQWSAELAAAAQASKPAGWDLTEWAHLVAAVCDRESGGGVYLRGDPAGIGSDGHGHGLMQLDDRPPHGSAVDSEVEQAGWRIKSALLDAGTIGDPAANLLAGARILANLIAAAPSTAAAVASYNAGDRVFSLDNPDSVTTGGDYSADVLRRADGFNAKAV